MRRRRPSSAGYPLAETPVESTRRFLKSYIASRRIRLVCAGLSSESPRPPKVQYSYGCTADCRTIAQKIFQVGQKDPQNMTKGWWKLFQSRFKYFQIQFSGTLISFAEYQKSVQNQLNLVL